jgi:hypothetical protein
MLNKEVRTVSTVLVAVQNDALGRDKVFAIDTVRFVTISHNTAYLLATSQQCSTIFSFERV